MGLCKCGPGKLKAQPSNYGLSVAVQQTHISKRQPVLVYLYRMKIYAELNLAIWFGQVSEF